MLVRLLDVPNKALEKFPLLSATRKRLEPTTAPNMKAGAGSNMTKGYVTAYVPENSQQEPKMSVDKTISHTLWAPFFLRRKAIVGFLFTFAAILIAIVALYSYSSRNHGFGLGYLDVYYCWKFGPTAGK
jgi:hypothetical protein